MSHVALRSLRTASGSSVRHVRALHASAARGDAGPSSSAEPAQADAAASSSASASSSAPAASAGASSSTPAKGKAPGKAKGKAQRPPRGAAAISPLDLDISSFPSLLHTPHPVLDAVEVHRRAPSAAAPYPTTLTLVNTEKLFAPTPPSAASLAISGGGAGGAAAETADYLPTVTPLSRGDVLALHRHVIDVQKVVQMSGKGKNDRMRALVVAGNGRGLVGVGEGKDANATAASKKAFEDAVKNLDYVERYEGRTIPTTIKGKYSASTVTMRPRPPGFGLRVPPSIHALARSAGIADLSASIEGSTNPTTVLKCAIGMLCGGAAPIGLGDGVGGPGRRGDKGAGMRSIREIEWARGKRIREVQRVQDA